MTPRRAAFPSAITAPKGSRRPIERMLAPPLEGAVLVGIGGGLSLGHL
jgi:hypothetical protein